MEQLQLGVLGRKRIDLLRKSCKLGAHFIVFNKKTFGKINTGVLNPHDANCDGARTTTSICQLRVSDGKNFEQLKKEEERNGESERDGRDAPSIRERVLDRRIRKRGKKEVEGEYGKPSVLKSVQD